MLKEKQITVKVFKLVSSEEVISRVVDETNEHYIIEKPRCLMMNNAGQLQFVPFMFWVDQDKRIDLNKSAIISIADPVPEISTGYESDVSGIALPTKSNIIT